MSFIQLFQVNGNYGKISNIIKIKAPIKGASLKGNLKMKATFHKCEWYGDEKKVSIFSKEEIEIPKDCTLEFLQDLVGGLIEIYNHEGKDLIFNEEGSLLNLPLNPFAVSQGLYLVGNIIEVHGVLK